jgi:mutator family transposase
LPGRSAFAGFRFPPEVIVVAIRWYLRYNLSYRDVEELLVERGVEVDHVTVYRWVQRFTPLLADAARFARHSPGDRWYADETYVKVNGLWRYVYRAVDQYGQVIDVLVSARRDAAAARRFFRRAIAMLKVKPTLDATYCKARVNRRVVSQAVVVATGVRGDGWREVLGFAVGDSEDGAFWTAFLRSLKARGLTGVQLVISDAHTGLNKRSARCCSAPVGKDHPSTSSAAGWSRRFTSAAGRGPWQRDLRGPAADPSLPAVAGFALASGSRASSTGMSVQGSRPVRWPPLWTDVYGHHQR